MSAPVRKLRWRITRGGRWLDLVEERVDGALAFVGLIDGRERVRAADRRQVEGMLIRAALN